MLWQPVSFFGEDPYGHFAHCKILADAYRGVEPDPNPKDQATISLPPHGPCKRLSISSGTILATRPTSSDSRESCSMNPRKRRSRSHRQRHRAPQLRRRRSLHLGRGPVRPRSDLQPWPATAPADPRQAAHRQISSLFPRSGSCSVAGTAQPDGTTRKRGPSSADATITTRGWFPGLTPRMHSPKRGRPPPRRSRSSASTCFMIR